MDKDKILEKEIPSSSLVFEVIRRDTYFYYGDYHLFRFTEEHENKLRNLIEKPTTLKLKLHEDSIVGVDHKGSNIISLDEFIELKKVHDKENKSFFSMLLIFLILILSYVIYENRKKKKV